MARSSNDVAQLRVPFLEALMTCSSIQVMSRPVSRDRHSKCHESAIEMAAISDRDALESVIAMLWNQ